MTAIDGLLLSLVIGVLLLNLPFGLWRSKADKFSVQWFAAIHLPVPVVFILRSFTGYSYKVIPLLLLASLAGQVLGGQLFAPQKVARVTEEE